MKDKHAYNNLPKCAAPPIPAKKNSGGYEAVLNKNNPNYLHNLFMRNADVWTDENDWTMSRDIFIKTVSELVK